ncbi:nicotinate-nucleotide--dimethylbenzimidazole phosphoribosyltransferase [Foetidibacter luteolus]|uniref:nicotinate-nucleotide--dimethylbenzimidazole phosphoribosyltransferase n=1 Tax=Foetidibacter luteolus TaxID=2608880 RepID=UPI00129A93A1|nr:nicotinate-nucleotide--dimethylbenzimidazole phosphoribosyltransferase [Foetidibacter luteolus]
MNNLQQQLQHIINNKTKPLGALGRLEDIALQAGLIQQTITPVIANPQVVVFAADHGIALTGLVNPYPQAVTAQMVLNFLSGGAAINVFCRQNQIGLTVVDAGVNYNFGSRTAKAPRFVDAKIAQGTNNYLQEAAMTIPQVNKAIETGKSIVRQLAAEQCNCIGFGEMGIGNTSSASLLMSAVTAIPLDDCTGRGTGANDEQLKVKLQTLQQVFRLHQLDKLSQHPVELLSKVGGFEIAMMVGAYIQAAEERMITVVDGFISTAALLVAGIVKPGVANNCIYAHTSGEKGHEQMLGYLNARPLLNLGMRLGEGTGAALAIPLIQSAVNFLNEMASFESANVSTAAT